MKKQLREGERIPKGYGIAYREVARLVVVAYPIPINVIVAGLRKVWLWFLYGHKLYENGYEKGYEEGREAGREYAFNQYKGQALQGEVKQIVENFLGVQDEAFRLMRENKDKVQGWITRFIDDETKRILKH